jgi:small subunit ribosomal protein S16
VLKIRLRRTGAKKQPRYRVVVAESRAPRDGAFVEVLGWYNPQTDPAQVVINTEKAAQWIARGAQPSDRVAYLLKHAEQGAATAVAVPAAAGPSASAAARTRETEAPATTSASSAVDASEAPESAGSASSVENLSTEPVESDAPESQGSSGVTPV